MVSEELQSSGLAFPRTTASSLRSNSSDGCSTRDPSSSPPKVAPVHGSAIHRFPRTQGPRPPSEVDQGLLEGGAISAVDRCCHDSPPTAGSLSLLRVSMGCAPRRPSDDNPCSISLLQIAEVLSPIPDGGKSVPITSTSGSSCPPAATTSL